MTTPPTPPAPATPPATSNPASHPPHTPHPDANPVRSVCVFCGARDGNDPAWTEEARELGRALARRDIRLVFGGGGTGMMGAVADGALEEGGQLTGVIPAMLVEDEKAHPKVDDMRVVTTMLERKTLLVDISDAFITLPGGLGTLDELFEVLTWKQLHLHDKPIAMLNTGGFWDRLLSMLDRCIDGGYLMTDSPAQLLIERDIEPLLERLAPAATHA